MKLFDEMLKLGYGLCSGKLIKEEDMYEFKFEAIYEDEITVEVMEYLYWAERNDHIISAVKAFYEDRFDGQGNNRCWVICVYVPVA